MRRSCLASTDGAPPLEVRVGRAQDGSTVWRMPVGRPLNLTERVRLVYEILASYREARGALRRMGIEPAVESLREGGQSDGERGSEREVLAEAWRLGRAVERTLRLTPGDTRCLTRSLVLTRLLARRGIQATLVIGACAEPSFRAHAWVEQAGHPVLTVGEDPFGRLLEL